MAEHDNYHTRFNAFDVLTIYFRFDLHDYSNFTR